MCVNILFLCSEIPPEKPIVFTSNRYQDIIKPCLLLAVAIITKSLRFSGSKKLHQEFIE